MKSVAFSAPLEPLVIAPPVFALEGAIGWDRRLRAVRPERVAASEVHPIEVAPYVRSWRASLGSDYAEWAKSMPGSEG